MTERLLLVLCLAAVWGAAWALFLQYQEYGRWLAMRRCGGGIGATSTGNEQDRHPAQISEKQRVRPEVM